tara:strand:+ start:87 stop:443 length:357 start_codon:yes stop_codon:yes gene_type:complete
MTYENEQQLRHPPRFRNSTAPQKVPTDFGQLAVFNPGRARRLTRPTRQAAIKMVSRNTIGGAAFQQIFNEVNPPARTIQLVAAFKIRRTGRIAESAMHTTPKYLIRPAASFGFQKRCR